jgi:hypothetical protein
MIYIPSFINIGSGIRKLIRGTSQKDRDNCNLISLLLFLQNKENRLKILNNKDPAMDACGPSDFVIQEERVE